MNARILNADELGEKGESRFREICADAQLICNASGRDRTGWDFIVEFPFDTSNNSTTLDQRRAPLSCHVQVKTIWESSDQLALRLSSAERLAKEPKPTFIYVFRVNETLEFVDSYLIHIVDDVLATILKRLRKEEAKGNFAINKSKITLCPSRIGGLLPPTGAAFLKALTEAAGNDISSYLVRKSRMLATLGFELDRRTAKVSFTVKNRDDIVDVFLGLKKGELTEYKEFETRFGIKLPVNQAEAVGQPFEVTPIPADTCTVSVREDNLSPPATIQGEIIVPAIPGLQFNQIKMLITSKFFRFTITGKTGEVQFETLEPNLNSSFPLDEWMNFFRMMAILAKGKSSVSVITSKGKVLPLPSPRPSEDNQGEVFEHLAEATEAVRRLFGLVGVSPPNVGFADIEEQSQEIIDVGALLAQRPEPLTFKTVLPEVNQTAEQLSMVYVGYLTIAGQTLAYHAVAEMVPQTHSDHLSWKSQSFVAREIRLLDDFPRGYSEFVEEAKKAARTPHAMVKPINAAKSS